MQTLGVPCTVPGAMSSAGRRSRKDARLSTLPISADSRMVKAGYLFAAVPGTKADGLAFLPQALAAGASAVRSAHSPTRGSSVRWTRSRTGSV